ncbi:hypothetical protein GCM10017674_66660 [Streptomyces gardneri]|uniref:Uncharacterized protein n=1 Tax=Streptomyces gardneri TaxID=66892 RepID=A0A4Y3RH13_9ACTN|nr:hypothetical protein SGA01_26960 [Streptomyces gardneri]GHH16591.1 hypothetical protein GCM10017674_66660 [Streptomyces gardneri]
MPYRGFSKQWRITRSWGRRRGVAQRVAEIGVQAGGDEVVGAVVTDADGGDDGGDEAAPGKVGALHAHHDSGPARGAVGVVRAVRLARLREEPGGAAHPSP